MILIALLGEEERDRGRGREMVKILSIQFEYSAYPLLSNSPGELGLERALPGGAKIGASGLDELENGGK